MILLSSSEAPADYSDKNRNNSKNDNISTRASNDGKREKAVTNLSSSLFPSRCPPRAFFFYLSSPSLLSKKASTDGGESGLIVDGFLNLWSVLTLSFLASFSVTRTTTGRDVRVWYLPLGLCLGENHRGSPGCAAKIRPDPSPCGAYYCSSSDWESCAQWSCAGCGIIFLPMLLF